MESGVRSRGEILADTLSELRALRRDLLATDPDSRQHTSEICREAALRLLCAAAESHAHAGFRRDAGVCVAALLVSGSPPAIGAADLVMRRHPAIAAQAVEHLDLLSRALLGDRAALSAFQAGYPARSVHPNARSCTFRPTPPASLDAIGSQLTEIAASAAPVGIADRCHSAAADLLTWSSLELRAVSDPELRIAAVTLAVCAWPSQVEFHARALTAAQRGQIASAYRDLAQAGRQLLAPVRAVLAR